MVYAVLGLAGVLALGCGLRWLSVTAALGVFAGLLAGGTLVLAGAALLATAWQPGVRPSAYSFAARPAPLNHQSEKADVRRHAVQGLGTWGWAEMVGLLEPVLADPDERVRAAARDALRDIRTRQQRGDG